MRRLILGIAILAVLLLISGILAYAMEQIHSPIAQQLQQAADAADREDWEKASALTQGAKARWERYWCFTAAVADHTPMDELDGLFAELEVYLQAREMPHFSATGQQLSQLARSMALSHRPSWWNII